MSTPTAPTVKIKKSARTTPSTPVPQPGALRNQARLEIQTRQAQFLLDGRTGPRGIIGLLQFARRLGDVCQAVQQDDPYADWMLLRVEESIAAAKAFVQEKNIATAKALNGLGAMKIELARTQEPAVVDLVFGTPYGFMGAYLLSEYDELARSVLTAQHCAVFDRRQAGELIRACGNAVRRVYQLPAAWRRTDITRDDVRQGTDAAANAAQLMGVLPEAVLAMNRRAKFAPRITGKPYADSGRGSADHGNINNSKTATMVSTSTSESAKLTSLSD
jgi:integrating conjugative element protein (TIGR03761 family)